MYTVKSLFDLVLPLFQGTSISTLRSPNNIAKSAALMMRSRIDLVESEHVVPLIPAMINGDNIYQYPQDAQAVIDIAPATGRNFSGEPFFKNSPSRDISLSRTQKPMFSVEWRNGMQLLRIMSPVGHPIPTPINACDSLTADGLVLPSGGAVNARMDTIQFLNGTGSIAFDINALSAQSVITFENMTSKDISAVMEGIASVGLFLPPNAEGKVSSVQLVLGSDVAFANAITMTTNTNGYGGAFTYGFNVLRFDLGLASETGTFNPAAVTQVKVIINTAGNVDAIIGAKIDAIMAVKGVAYDLSYYSKNLFQLAGTSAMTDSPTDAGLMDTIICGDDAINIMINEMIKLCAKELRGKEGQDQIAYATKELDGVYGDMTKIGLYAIYKERNISGRLGVGSSY